jgi:tetratricopeptide (TPR) repeat protein
VLLCSLLLNLHGCAFVTESDGEDDQPRSARRAVLDRRNDLEIDNDEPTPGLPPQLNEETLPDAGTATPSATATANRDARLEPTPDLKAAGAVRPTPPASATANDSAAVSGPGPQPAQRPIAEADSVLALITNGTPPQSAAALRLIEEGRGLLAQSQIDRARERFERAVAVDPSSAYGYYFLAKANYLAKQYDQANNFAARATGLAARTSMVWQGRIAALQGEILEAGGRYPDARQAYQRALRSDPQNAKAQSGLARLGAK